MATQVQELPGHGKQRYPWEKWENGRAWKARQGVDFDCKPTVFRRIVVNRATHRGLAVTTRVDGDVVFFQFSDKK